ncbi:EAL domain-containing protein [Roseibium marinum]|uniref:Cyclic-di-GMP phosphodiesterase TipF (Flagellum assembly factor) n=1 Tax=Roseibium marinum TaxID=281252 RepID=A0A2S3V4G7_9HYPH|nr:EAL domain-containing protein [Roseibium marinum]POF34673.1 cyclic-di-GMP phosphodiesterase TipF (flagellum assembly factor) [Roseibium marinum]
MGRTGTIFVAICMGVIALSSATVLVFQFGRPFGESMSLSLALMCTMILVHLLIGRARDRSAVGEAVDRLEDRMADLDEDVGNLEGRLTGMEHAVPRRTRAEIDPLFAEVEVLGTLVKQMAEAMADLETKVEDQQALTPPPRMQSLPRYPQGQQPQGYQPQGHQPQGHQPQVHQPVQGYPGESQPAHQPGYPAGPYPAPDHMVEPQQGYGQFPPSGDGHGGPAEAYSGSRATGHSDMAELDRRYGVHAPRHPEDAMRAPDVYAADPKEPGRLSGERAVTQPNRPGPDMAMRELVASALNANRVELHLQPIVSLPQRQVKYYEAYTRLRDSAGNLIEASRFLPEAVQSGQIARIDNLLLFRSIQVIRRLTSRNRNAVLFCNISALSLVDETFFPGFLEFVKSNRIFADALVFEFSQSDVADMGPMELESLSALYEAGFRFSIDQISDMKMDFNSLAGRGFKYGKLHADYLIGRREAKHGHIHPSDFGDLLHRYGMELITDHVETESQVLELLDYDVKLAQGNLFSPPRPVKAEVLQGTPAPGPRKSAAG